MQTKVNAQIKKDTTSLAYDHSKVGVEYAFGGVLTNMKVSALYVYKGKKGDDYNIPRYFINKVDLSHFSLVVNYRF